ncbi:alpha-L-fucosidase [Sphingobacterium nematocida]|uniref:alpha-L-fucosidase n=1 Tax=Sphingobacterium nematocida TaxID=1513896 RepID=A0A1T5ATQ0_9SPHI|nr:alpha-L-fucosidase [Sphingobacterium nematocida]SKB38295.1 alpha-L-fucosidase [Sphingobacterium nematocida]
MKKRYLYLLNFLFPTLLIGQSAPAPYGVLPSERQLRWHEMELYTLIHFTPTTFQNKEWGYGDADPQIFNPRRFDADQIAKAAAAGGFKGLISVAKHHDGFCLWPTATTSYSIASSPWKNGKGDMVRDFKDATLAHGMQFGIYLSAWDRNDTRYGTPAYADAYREQLTELMTGYGDLFTSWHDGANGGDGYYGGKKEKRTIDRSTYYAWEEKTWPIIRRYQPLANIFSDVGPDMRWVGNEHGFAAETSWATFTPEGIDGRPPVPGDSNYKLSPEGTRHGDYWIPAECDVPQRPGWFYHPEQDEKVKTPDQLFEIYLKSVGRGANMNLGLAPTPDGYLHENDVKSLTYFGRKLAKTFEANLAKDASITANNIRANAEQYGTHNLLDDDRYSYYATDDAVVNPILEINLRTPKEFDIIRLRENIKLGQRLDSVAIEVFENEKWAPLAKATSIGSTRLIKFKKPIRATKLRVYLYAPVAPALSDFGLFKEYKEDFKFDYSAPSKVKLPSSSFKLRNKKWNMAVDNNVQTFAQVNDKKEEIVFALNNAISAIGYLPRQDGKKEGMITKFSLLISDNGKTWKPYREGEFSNIQSNPIEQIIYFGAPLKTKYIKFIAKEAISDVLTASEIILYR